jgi:poly-beta-1,6-N-acetyl-D-glucosamine biosynthesis protein PgaD
LCGINLRGAIPWIECAPVQNTLIINARRQLSWYRRLWSDASTFALWSAWLWLCRPAVFAVTGLLSVVLGVKHPPLNAVAVGPALSYEWVVLALIGTSSLLLLWNRLSSQPAVRPRFTAMPDYASHFSLEPQEIAAGRDSTVCVVHHDEHGQITRIHASR